MPKNILIFSDGTGQIGGLRPDQRLSNVYKMYRAMRPGPSSPIKPTEQVAFYDPGLGAGETSGITIRRINNMLEAAVGTGIDDNVIDCYEKIISYYEPGDSILLFGFSRGAYTVRALANVMNLCGIPTRMPDGSAVPRYGPKLRKIATDAVKYVYNHGTGKPRGQKPYYQEREEKGRRFRQKYGSAPTDGTPDVQGNVQPTFIGVFDTVASLGNPNIKWLVRACFAALITCLILGLVLAWSWPVLVTLIGAFVGVTLWYLMVLKSQFKYFFPYPKKPQKFSNPGDWLEIWKKGHRAVWRKEHYDRWLDSDVGFARHALAIDEERADFPRVGWGMRSEAEKTKDRQPIWLKQVWFAGCHSDVGGSYPEPESRLSDIALEWMIAELEDCIPDIQIRKDMLVTSLDPLGLQHSERKMKLGPLRFNWKLKPRIVPDGAPLHPSVLKRIKAVVVPQLDEIKPYRPKQLSEHSDVADFYKK